MKKTILFTLLIALIACNKGAKFEEIDLMQYGVPIMVNAPADAKVKAEKLADVIDDIVISDEASDFYMQIYGTDATTTDVKALKEEQLTEIKENESSYFVEVVSEDDRGFIYKKQIDDETETYDFRYVMIQKDKQYIFQMISNRLPTLAEVQKVYSSFE